MSQTTTRTDGNRTHPTDNRIHHRHLLNAIQAATGARPPAIAHGSNHSRECVQASAGTRVNIAASHAASTANSKRSLMEYCQRDRDSPPDGNSSWQAGTIRDDRHARHAERTAIVTAD
jgi:hypothetical protein